MTLVGEARIGPHRALRATSMHIERIKLLATGLDVGPLRESLQEHEELWDERRARTAPPDSPHHGLSDIWARWAAPGVDGSRPHESVWYPCVRQLPEVVTIAQGLMRDYAGEQLGGVLITKIPAFRTCRPHTDPGWHARYYEKFAVQVQSAPGQAFHFERESLVTRPGDVFWFDNAYTHWVTNPTPHDRITLIACIRRKQG